MTNLEQLKTLIILLEQEVECLRSVLSEFEGDKSEYVQMIRADNFRRVIDDIRCRRGEL